MSSMSNLLNTEHFAGILTFVHFASDLMLDIFKPFIF